jgi:hypothetical protein
MRSSYRQGGNKMKKRFLRNSFSSLLSLVFWFFSQPDKRDRQAWEVLNPEGVIKIEAMKVNPHLQHLKGRPSCSLEWKHNGDKFLEKWGAEAEGERCKVIKSWEVAPETVDPIAGSQEEARSLRKR